MAETRRRAAGDGGISEYTTSAGPRYAIRFYVPQSDGPAKRVQKRGFRTKKEAAKALRETLGAIERRTYTPPSKQTLETYLELWLAGRRLRASTRESYRRTIRLHIVPHLGSLKLDAITTSRIDRMYRSLETDGFRRGADAGTKGLSARTVRYAATILHAALKSAVHDGLLVVNPADRATPPTASEAKAPEMDIWTPEQAKAFLSWAAGNRDDWEVWHVLVSTGMRRGELVGLRWGDVDFETSTVSVRRSIGVVMSDGARTLTTGPTKTGKARMVDLDSATADMLRRIRAERGSLSLTLVAARAAVFGQLDGGPTDPDTLSARFKRHLASAQAALGAEAVPTIRVHDLRHTHATALLRAGTPVKVVSERLGHTDVTTTLRVYQHVLPGMQSQAAATFASLLA